MRWDLFCRVIDNHGDLGVCWRLAEELAARGESVTLWVDAPEALAWMAPAGAAGVTLRDWTAATGADPELTGAPGDVVIEAFGCELPPAFVSTMAARAAHGRPPCWINLEYLSAEDYAARSHRLPSPQLAGPGRGLVKWFFYPGFTADTGGLLRERDLLARQRDFDRTAWRRAQSLDTAPGERLVSLFCYANAALPALLTALAEVPTLLAVTAGIATREVRALHGAAVQRGALRFHYLPPLTQRDFDHLLWACELNLVRGEDSFVRAQLAGRPWLWQAYPQPDGVHGRKLEALLDHMLAGADPGLAAALRSAAQAWNGLAPATGLALPPLAPWQAQAQAWRERLLALPELASSLQAFVGEAR